MKKGRNGILLPKLFWPIVRKNCSSDREKLLKFETEGWEFAKILRSLEQFIQTVKGQNNFGKKWLGFRNMQEKLEKNISKTKKVHIDLTFDTFIVCLRNLINV